MCPHPNADRLLWSAFTVHCSRNEGLVHSSSLVTRVKPLPWRTADFSCPPEVKTSPCHKSVHCVIISTLCICCAGVRSCPDCASPDHSSCWTSWDKTAGNISQEPLTDTGEGGGRGEGGSIWSPCLSYPLENFLWLYLESKCLLSTEGSDPTRAFEHSAFLWCSEWVWTMVNWMKCPWMNMWKWLFSGNVQSC